MWPLKSPALQASVKQPESVHVPIEDLQLIAAVAEYEQTRGKRIKMKDLAYQCRQAIDRLAHVRTATSQVNSLNVGEIQHSLVSALTTSVSNRGSKSGATSIATPPILTKRLSPLLDRWSRLPTPIDSHRVLLLLTASTGGSKRFTQ